MNTTAVLACGLFSATALHPQNATSGDAYARFEPRTSTWILGTAKIERRLRFDGGRFGTVGLQNKAARREYVAGGSRPEEFRITAGGVSYTGDGGGWTSDGGRANVVQQGEIEVTIALHNDRIAVEKHYVVYAETGIIREWLRIENRSPSAITISDPYFLDQRLHAGEPSRLSLQYMTGGGSFSGSQVLKHVRLSPEYSRTFDSSDKPERMKVSGVEFGGALPYGSGVYMPWFCIADETAAEGVYAGLDYYGHWAAEIGNRQGGPGYLAIRLAKFEYSLEPGHAVESPKAMIGVFKGDLDDMGNDIKAWQYRYLWDLTNKDYFAKIRMAVEMRWQAGKGSVYWGGGTQDNWDYRMAALLHTVDVMRYVGADIAWQDAGWHDHLGDNDGPDYGHAQAYLKQYGMKLAVWWPLYSVARESRAYREHPDWRTSAPGIGGTTLDTSREDVIKYLQGQLNGKIAAWGDFQWRLDGTAVVPVNGNETPLLEEYHNVFALQRGFRTQHPGASIDLCSGGGNLMGFDALRVSDVSQLTDGGSMQFGNYYSSYLFPPDKIDDWTRNANFTWENARAILTTAAAWVGDVGLYGHEPGLTINNGYDNLRRTFEIYRYMVREGVAGRWVQVYHPRVVGADPIYFLERLSGDRQRGVIVLKKFPRGVVTIYPKGLIPDKSYDIRYEMLKRSGVRTGRDVMEKGITLADPAPGELIYVGLPDHPGSGTDRIAPSDPGQVQKRIAANVGITGVELEWTSSADNQWLSYYQIYRDGKLIDRVSTGTYYFDHSGGPENVDAQYEVQAVDGDGNCSRRVAAVATGGGTLVYTAWGGYLAGKDYSYQGANGWHYEEWSDTRHTPLTWDGALGQMGYYSGAAGAHHAAAGASWLLPGDQADVVRVFVAPYSGNITIGGTAHKDVYSTYGDGVRLKILKNAEQLWPESGWKTIAADDIKGVEHNLRTSVKPGDRICFVVNAKEDAVSDETVWNPRIEYEGALPTLEKHHRIEIDDLETSIRYTGRGWQKRGVTPWGGDLDEGYLPVLNRGSISVSGTPGDKFVFRFRGSGIEVLGSTGSDHGVATIRLDNQDAGSIDTFVPENINWLTESHPSEIRMPARVPGTVRLWSISGLPNQEHTLEFIVAGRKNSQSTGTFVAVDKLTVWDGVALDAAEKP